MNSKHQSRSDATRARILEAARALFNAEGTAAVSTNRVAAEAGLSPGNLYYHFSDKKAIIRELHARYAEAHEERWRPDPDGRKNLVMLGENLALGTELAWEYRFFGREMIALLRVDPLLRKAYDEIYRHRLQEWSAFGEQLVAQGLLRAPRPPRTLADLTVAIWLIAESWLGFLDITGDPQDRDQLARGSDLVMVAIEPYLTAKARQALRAHEGGAR